jgi:hypothetical protein
VCRPMLPSLMVVEVAIVENDGDLSLMLLLLLWRVGQIKDFLSVVVAVTMVLSLPLLTAATKGRLGQLHWRVGVGVMYKSWGVELRR